MSISAEFFAFAREASASARAAGVSSLICDYLHMDLTLAESIEVESILCVLLDDPSPLVRRAIAEGLAHEAKAPPHIILALAGDQPDIAAIVLQHARQFSEAELAELALGASVGPQMAIARRAQIGAPVCAALIDTGAPFVLVELASNEGAHLSQAHMLRMLERAVRLKILDDVSDALSQFLNQSGWLPPERSAGILRDARERAIVQLGAASAEQERQGAPGAALSLVRHLRGQGQLTPALILRALLSGDRLMLAAAMAELSAYPIERVLGHLDHPAGSAFAALYAKADLPEAMRPVFVALLEAIDAQDIRISARPDRRLLAVAMAESQAMPAGSGLRMRAFLGRLEAESARAALSKTDSGPSFAALSV